MDETGPRDPHVARGWSAYGIIRELTETTSPVRLAAYADTFQNSTDTLARYFSLSGGGNGKDWEFHRRDAANGWVLNHALRTSGESRGPSLRALIFFAHRLQQPCDVAAEWARAFLDPAGTPFESRRLEISAAKLRPFAEAGMPAEDTAVILHHELPRGVYRYHGQAKLEYRLTRAKEYIKMHEQGIPTEYILAAGL